MKDKRKIIKTIALLGCMFFGFIVFFLDAQLERPDYSVAIEGDFTEFTTSWTLETKGEDPILIELPMKSEEFEAGQTLTLVNRLPDTINSNEYVFFRARHQFVEAFIENELIYSYGVNDRVLYGKTPSSAWILIPIDETMNNSEIRIELTGVYPKYSDIINTISIANRSSILYMIVANRFPSVLLCFVLFVIGISIIVIALILGNAHITRSLYRLGVLVIIISIWSISVTNVLQVFFENPLSLLNFEFFMFHLILPVFIWFLLSFDYYSNKKILHRLFWFSILLFIVIEVLQLSNIADYMETLLLKHVLMALTVLYLSIIGIKALLHKEAPEEVKVFTISVLILLLFTGIDLFRFYLESGLDEGAFTRIGILTFVFLWIREIIQNISKVMVRIAQTEILEQLAFQDQLTGLSNRRAFEQELDKYRHGSIFRDVYLIAFDVNNLKTINDTYGHEQGDDVIKLVAENISTEFNNLGSCYRIGGDEFFAIIEETDTSRKSEILQKLQSIGETIYQSSKLKSMDYSIASGLALLSENNNDIDATCRNADGMMYENKLSMKSAVF